MGNKARIILQVAAGGMAGVLFALLRESHSLLMRVGVSMLAGVCLVIALMRWPGRYDSR